MKKNKPISILILKSFTSFIATILISSFLTYLSKPFIADDLNNIAHYHTKIFLSIFSLFGAFIFISSSIFISKTHSILTAFILSLFVLTLASSQLIQIQDISSQETTSLPFYTTVIGVITSLTFLWLIQLIKNLKKTKH